MCHSTKDIILDLVRSILLRSIYDRIAANIAPVGFRQTLSDVICSKTRRVPCLPQLPVRSPFSRSRKRSCRSPRGWLFSFGPQRSPSKDGLEADRVQSRSDLFVPLSFAFKETVPPILVELRFSFCRERGKGSNPTGVSSRL